MTDLAKLSAAATDGPWYQSGSPWFTDGKAILAGSPDGNIAAFLADLDPFDYRGERDRNSTFDLAEPEADAAFIVALVNAFRSGHLIDPTDDAALARAGLRRVDQARLAWNDRG